MRKIDITCKNCGDTYSVDMTDEIPENVKKLLCNFCPICHEDDYYEEDYVYYELSEQDIEIAHSRFTSMIEQIEILTKEVKESYNKLNDLTTH